MKEVFQLQRRNSHPLKEFTFCQQKPSFSVDESLNRWVARILRFLELSGVCVRVIVSGALSFVHRDTPDRSCLRDKFITVVVFTSAHGRFMLMEVSEGLHSAAGVRHV